MNAPLEVLFAQGRNLSLGAMLIAAVVTLMLGKGIRRIDWRNASMYIAAVNLLILFKLFLYGNSEIFLLGSFAIAIQILVFVLCASRYEQESFERSNLMPHVVKVIYIFSILFLSCNVYAYIYFPGSSVVQISGRFFGITANPQHLAMVCALCVPALLYSVVHYGVKSIVGVSAGAMLACILFLEYQSGSRLGFFGTLLCIIMGCRVFFDRRRIVYVLLLSIVALPLVYFSFYDSISDLIRLRFVEGRADTRSEYWASGWNQFLQSPLTGSEPSGEPAKYYFTVSSWISAAASGGVIALIFLVMFLLSSIGYVYNVNRLRNRHVDTEYLDLYISAIVLILAISVFEAVFLGVFSSHTMMVYLYVAGAGSLVGAKSFLNAPHHKFYGGRGLRVGRL
ncbi:O-antigen ligase [Mesorhizobium sp.]|nr:O-antigen ligase family protein [Mesorhizobium sp.]